LTLFALAGATILLLAALDLLRDRDADALLLFLWVAGTFLFAAVVNWTVNERSLLPMAPAVGILLMRRIDSRRGIPRQAVDFRLFWPLLPAALLALLVAAADCRLADSARTAAYQLHEEAGGFSGPFWFHGHWGFQYYMELLGAKPVDLISPDLNPGDLMAIPSNATNLIQLPPEIVRLRKVIELHPNHFLSTMDRATGSGFYASVWGPLPFAVGPIPPERYLLIMLVDPASNARAPGK